MPFFYYIRCILLCRFVNVRIECVRLKNRIENDTSQAIFFLFSQYFFLLFSMGQQNSGQRWENTFEISHSSPIFAYRVTVAIVAVTKIPHFVVHNTLTTNRIY